MYTRNEREAGFSLLELLVSLAILNVGLVGIMAGFLSTTRGMEENRETNLLETAYANAFVMELSIRRVEIAGITPNPHAVFMAQVARNLTDPDDGFLHGKRYLIHDRDTKFTDQFLRILKDDGVKSVKLPPRSPLAP